MASVIFLWSSKYKMVIVTKLQKNASKDSGIIFMIVIIYFYNCYYVYTLSIQLVTSSRYKSHPATLVLKSPSEDSCCS